mgnify:CR=1 FL=1
MYVEMRDICKNYGNFRASDHVSFGIEKGKLVALLGPSGSGKTTLLRMIAGLETPNSGDIYIDGQRVNDVPAAKRGIGFVFQNYALFRYMTVYDNVAFGLELAKVPKKEIEPRVKEVLRLVNLDDYGDRSVTSLSGGEQQRVAIARALVNDPAVILADEATGNLDTRTSFEVLVLFQQLHAQGRTIIFVTHNPEIARYSSRNVTLRDGHIISDVRNEQILSAAEALAKLPATDD